MKVVYIRGGTAISKVVRLALFQYSTLKGLEYKSTLQCDLYAQAYIRNNNKASKKVVRSKPDLPDGNAASVYIICIELAACGK